MDSSAEASIHIQTTSACGPCPPPWLGEVVIVAGQLANKEVLDAFVHRVRLRRGRFGSYEPIDFLALLIGYAIGK